MVSSPYSPSQKALTHCRHSNSRRSKRCPYMRSLSQRYFRRSIFMVSSTKPIQLTFTNFPVINKGTLCELHCYFVAVQRMLAASTTFWTKAPIRREQLSVECFHACFEREYSHLLFFYTFLPFSLVLITRNSLLLYQNRAFIFSHIFIYTIVVDTLWLSYTYLCTK